MTKQKIWQYKKFAARNELKDELVRASHLSPLFVDLLIERGIDSPQKIVSFFHPSLDNLHDPFLMKDMERAVERLTLAIQENERVLVYGDYDVDGTTAVSLVYRFLGELGVDVGIYIPDRYREGYGISELGVHYAVDNGYSLVIALDCGIKACNEIALARELGVDFIICDHHFPDEEIPKAYAVLDPKQANCPYPCKALSGAGVGFKLLQALTIRHGFSFESLVQHLDLLAISIAADLVEIVDENRIFVTYGLRLLNEHPSPGIKALEQVAGIGDREINIQDIIFRLGPRINAAGRMMNGTIAVELFTSPDPDTAELYAQLINSTNIRRQGIDRLMTSEALRMLANDRTQQFSMSTFLFNKTWHMGVIGIVASRLVDMYYRPTVILTESNGIVSGSARSVVGFDIYDAISDCADLLDSFGGHKQAVGLTMRLEKLEDFKARFEEVVARKISQSQMQPIIEIDALLDFDDLTTDFLTTLEAFAPFGPGNTAPTFALKNLRPDPRARLFGRNHEHMKLVIARENETFSFTGIAYQQAALLNLVQNQPFNICFSIEKNTFYTPAITQFNIKDIVAAGIECS